MNFKALAEFTGLSEKAIKYLAAQGIIVEPLEEHHIFFMQDLSKIWGKPQFIKLQVARYNPTKRARIVFGAGLTRIEEYIHNRWLAYYANRTGKQSLHVSQVVDEAMNYHNLPAGMRVKVTASAYKMRQKARNTLYRKGDELDAAVEGIALPNQQRLEKKIAAQNEPRSSSPAHKYTQNDIFGWHPK